MVGLMLDTIRSYIKTVVDTDNDLQLQEDVVLHALRKFALGRMCALNF